jgi:hypothetical protein
MSASWRTSDLTVLAIAAAGTVLLTIASFVAAPPDTQPRNDGSSFATHADGAGAAFVLLKALGYEVERSYEPLNFVRADPERTTLVLANASTRPSDQDVRALRSFLERGGRVLLTGPLGHFFVSGLPDRVAGRASQAKRRIASLPSPVSSGVPEIEMPSASVPLPADSPFVPVYGGYGDAAVAIARVAQGTVVWWAGSAPLANRGLGDTGHVELLVNSLGPSAERRIVWDEFYHGHTRSFWSYLAGTPLPAAFLHVAALSGLAVFTFTRRRQPIRPPVVEPRTSPLEFVDTMAGLYGRARAAHAAVAAVRSRVRRRLLEIAGLPASASDERLAEAAQERLALGVDLAGILLRSREHAADSTITSTQALATVAELQAAAASADASPRRRQRT